MSEPTTILSAGKWLTESYADEGSALSFEVIEKLADVRSPYQHIEIYRTRCHGNLMMIDGCVMLTSRDNFLYHEMLSHPALFSHSKPQHLVIIGGGDCGTLSEALKHPSVRNVVQIDIDEEVTRLSKDYFPELSLTACSDPRASLCFEDGITWMQQAASESADVIMIDSTDPVGVAKGLFSDAFLADCFRVLRPNGILVQQTESPLYHFESIIQKNNQALLRVGFNHRQVMCFPQPCYPSGWWSVTLSGKNQPVHLFREADARKKAFPTRYYNADIHLGALATPEFMR